MGDEYTQVCFDDMQRMVLQDVGTPKVIQTRHHFPTRRIKI